jgi:hypothetical protein
MSPVFRQIESLFLFPYVPENKILLQPVGVIKPSRINGVPFVKKKHPDIKSRFCTSEGIQAAAKKEGFILKKHLLKQF